MSWVKCKNPSTRSISIVVDGSKTEVVFDENGHAEVEDKHVVSLLCERFGLDKLSRKPAVSLDEQEPDESTLDDGEE